MMGHNFSGWWLDPTPLKKMKVSWDDEIPNIWKIKNVPNHQPVLDTFGSISIFWQILANSSDYHEEYDDNLGCGSNLG